VRRRYGVLVLAVILIAFSFGLRRYTTGGSGQLMGRSDSLVQAALEFAVGDSRAGSVASQGTFMSARQSRAEVQGEAFRIHIGLEYRGYPWLLTVIFDAQGEPARCALEGWTGITFSNYLRIVGIVLAVAWFAQAFVSPLFGVRCPDCTTNPLLPVVTEIRDEVVFGGGRDVEGYALAPIVERSYVCPECGYRKVTYIVPHTRKSASARDTIDLSPAGVDLWKRFPMERMLDRQREEIAGRLTFRTFDEWQDYYNRLKMEEREERRPVSK